MSTLVHRAALLACSCSFLVAERALAQELGTSLTAILQRHGIHLTPEERAELFEAARRDQQHASPEVRTRRGVASKLTELNVELQFFFEGFNLQGE